MFILCMKLIFSYNYLILKLAKKKMTLVMSNKENLINQNKLTAFILYFGAQSKQSWQFFIIFNIYELPLKGFENKLVNIHSFSNLQLNSYYNKYNIVMQYYLYMY